MTAFSSNSTVARCNRSFRVIGDDVVATTCNGDVCDCINSSSLSRKIDAKKQTGYKVCMSLYIAPFFKHVYIMHIKKRVNNE